jgi:cell division protein FtsL
VNLPAGTRTDRKLRSGGETGGWTRRWVILCVLVLAAPLSFLYVNQTSSLAATGYDVAVLEGEKKIWQMRNEQLRLEVSQLESLDRIDRLAASKLGMGPPQHQIYVNAPALILPTPVSASAAATPARPSRITWVIQQLFGKR